jgi:hypothetical protein
MVPLDSYKASPTSQYSGYLHFTIFYVYGIITLYDGTFQNLPLEIIKLQKSYNPSNALTMLVWALPRSLATT